MMFPLLLKIKLLLRKWAWIEMDVPYGTPSITPD
jgi:hypothetical protein